MKRIGPQDLAEGRVFFEKAALQYVCSGCRARRADGYGFCACSDVDAAAIATCAACGGSMSDLALEYVSTGERGGTVSKVVDGWECGACHRVAVSDYFTERIDELAASCDEDVQFLPEQGILTPSRLEILASIDAVERPADDVVVADGGIELRYGEQSPLFAAALGLVTAWDTADYGHEMSYTLSVSPPPPYNAEQRGRIHLLLHQLQLELEFAIDVWSAHFVPHPRAEVEERFMLASLLAQWSGDSDRAALALCHAFAVDAPPGRFTTSFRLLELLLERMTDEDIARKRHDPGTSDADFLELAKTYQVDLKTRIRRRVDALRTPPTETLRALWRIVAPGRAYNGTQVFQEIAQFRNRFVHKPSDQVGLALPWEEPDFASFAELIVELAAAMIRDRV